MQTPTASPVTLASARRIAAAGAIGSIIEWYDYCRYGLAVTL